MAFRAFLTARTNWGVGFLVSARRSPSSALPRSLTSAVLILQRGHRHWPMFLMFAMRTLLTIVSHGNVATETGNILFGIVCGIAVEPGEDTSCNSIRELNENTMFVGLSKLALENELDDLMV